MNFRQSIYSFFITAIFAAFFITNAQQQIKPPKFRSDVLLKENASVQMECIAPNVLQVNDISFSAGSKVLPSASDKQIFSINHRSMVPHFSWHRISSSLFRKFILNGQLLC